MTFDLLDIEDPAQAQAAELASDYGLDNHGLTNLALRLLEPARRGARTRRSPSAARARITRGGAVVVDTGKHSVALRAATSSSSASRPPRSTTGGASTTARSAPTSSTSSVGRHARLPPGPRPLRPGLLRRRRPGVPAADPGRHRARLAQPLRPEHVHAAARPGGATGSTSRSSRSSALPSFKAYPPIDGTRIGDLHRRSTSSGGSALIGGTAYAGEIKKSVFTRPELPAAARGRAVACTARRTSAPDGDSALFFGLSGTGKTTLSADPQRGLIGDDEHGWSDEGVFNFEDGCYAKVIRLSADGRAGDLRDDAPLRHDPRERRLRPGHAARSTSTTTRSPRTRAPRTRSTSSRTPSPSGRAGTRRTSSS